MTVKTLNRWRVVYLAEAVLFLATQVGRAEVTRVRDAVPEPGSTSTRQTAGSEGRAAAIRSTLTLGAALWLMHDLAHGRWQIVVADLLALAGCLSSNSMLVVAGVAYAVATPEREPSPFIWGRTVRRANEAPRDTSSAPAGGRIAFRDRPGSSP